MTDAAIATMIALPMFFVTLLVYAGLKLGDRHAVLKWFIFLLIPVGFWASAHLAVVTLAESYSTFTEMQEALGFYTQIVSWIFTIMLSYFLIDFIRIVFLWIGARKQEKAEGVEY